MMDNDKNLSPKSDVEMEAVMGNDFNKAQIVKTKSSNIPEAEPFIVNPKVVKTTPDSPQYGNLDEIFDQRNNTHPTSPMDVLTHLLKASLGTGILAMPKAFACSGLVMGVFLTILVAIICTHCSYVLVKCAHELYKRTGRHTMNYSEVAEECFKTGPRPVKRFATFFKYLIPVGLFATYFLTCAAYTVIIAHNIYAVLKHFGIELAADELTSIRILIACLLVPLIFMAWIPNLHYLAPVSMIANVCMGVGLGITFYYLVVGENALSDEDFSYVTHPKKWGEFFALTIFAMQAIGVMMPLENSMSKSQPMLGFCGVLNKGMSGVTVVYLVLGILGYIRYGSHVSTSITLDLGEAIPAQIVKVAIAVAVYCTFGLQFFVCLEISNDYIKKKFTKKPILMDYVARTVMTIVCTGLAALVPSISPIMSLVGAFCFSIIGLLVPVVLESVTFWNQPNGLGKFYWIVVKNVIIGLFGLMALVLGTKSAISGMFETAVASAEVNS